MAAPKGNRPKLAPPDPDGEDASPNEVDGASDAAAPVTAEVAFDAAEFPDVVPVGATLPVVIVDTSNAASLAADALVTAEIASKLAAVTGLWKMETALVKVATVAGT